METMKIKNKSLYIIALIALVNMLGYGIIIPILYSFSIKYGLTDFQNGLLFASFSICQFIATPIIGRFSDKYGRRPMLLLSITGTAISFFMMAFAPNAIFLFLARMLDGITAGNIPVALAVISDTTKPEDRPRAFGIVGAAFNFGFIFGPAIAALTITFNPAFPFIFAGIVTIAAIVITALFLPETNEHIGEVKEGKLFDLPKLWHTLFDKNVGPTFLITLIYFTAFACAIIYGFQPFTINILKISPSQNAQLFTLFGIIGLISQTLIIARVTKYFGIRHAFSVGLLLTATSFMIMFFAHNLPVFIIAAIILAVANSISQTLIPAILSQETDAKSQGSIMGLNTSYQSLGMIVGPILGGFIATNAIPLTFLTGSALVILCFFLSFRILQPGVKKESVF